MTFFYIFFSLHSEHLGLCYVGGRNFPHILKRGRGPKKFEKPCCNACFASFSCHEARTVSEGKTCCISFHFCSYSHLQALIHGCKTERMQSRVQASEMWFLRRIKGVTLLDKVCNSEIHNSLNFESLFLRIERSQLRWFGHVNRMLQDRLSIKTGFVCHS